MDDAFYGRTYGGSAADEAPQAAPPPAPPEDDFYGRSYGGAGAAPATAAPTPAPAEWSDYPKYGLSIAQGWRSSALSGMAGLSEDPQARQALEDTAAVARRNREQAMESMTPAGRTSAEAPLLSRETLAHPGRALAYGAESFAGTAAPYVAAGAIGGVPAMVGLGAAQGYGDVRDQVHEAVQQAPESKLEAFDPDYALIKQHLPDQQARQWLADKVLSTTGADKIGAVMGALLGGAGGIELSGVAGKIGLGVAETAALKGSRVDQLAKNAGRGFLEMGVPGAAQQVSTQHAIAQTGAGEEPTLSDVGKGLATYGGFGAIVAGTQTGGRAHVKRTERDYQKPEAKFETPPETIQTPHTAPAIPPSPLDDPAHQAAMEGRVITPSQREREWQERAEAGRDNRPVSTPSQRRPYWEYVQGEGAYPPGANQPPVTPRVSEPGIPPAPTADTRPVYTPAMRQREAEEMAQASQETRPVYTPGQRAPDWREIQAARTEAEREAAYWAGEGAYAPGANPPAPPDTTLRSHRPQAEPVIPPSVVQPRAPRAPRAAEAPPAPAATEPPPALRPAPEARPAPAPAPALREPDDTLRAQHAELTDGKATTRDLVVYPADVQPLALPKRTYGSVTLPDGRTVQYYRYGPNKFGGKDNAEAKINYLAEQGKLESVVGTPAAAAEEPGKGPPAVAAEAVPAAPQTQAERFEAERKARVAKYEAEKEAEKQKETVQSEIVTPTPESKPAPGRVLRTVGEATTHVPTPLREGEEAKAPAEKHRTKEEKLKIDHVNTTAEKIAQAHPFKELTHDWANQTFTRAKAMVDAAKTARITIPSDFREGHPYNPHVLKLREAADLVSKPNPSKDMFARFMEREHLIDQGKHEEAYAARRAEGAAMMGAPEGAVETRPGEHKAEETSPEDELIAKQEAEAAGEAPEQASPAPDPWTVEENATKENILRKIEAAKRTAKDQNISQIERDNAERGVQRLQDALTRVKAPERTKIEVKEGEHYTTPKTGTAGFQQKTLKSRAIKNKYISEPPTKVEKLLRDAGWTDAEIDEFTQLGGTQEEASELQLVGPESYMGTATKETKPELVDRPQIQTPNRSKNPTHVNMPLEDGRIVRIPVRRNSNVKDMLSGIANEIRQSGWGTGELAHEILQKIIDLVGDMPVRYVSKKAIYDFARLDTGEDPRLFRPGGFYHFNTHQIVINDQAESHEWLAHVKFHEAVHAATSVALDRFPEFAAQIRQIMNAADWTTEARDIRPYAFKNEHEFIAEIFSNPEFREHLAERNIPNELKKQMDIAAWRKLTGFKRGLKTMWDLTAMLIGKVLRLPPRGVSFLEATLAATEPYMIRHAEDMASGKGRMMWNKIDFIQEPERYAQAQADDAQRAASKPKEYWDATLRQAERTGAAEKIYGLYTKAANSDTLRIASEHLFGKASESNPMRRVQEGMEKLGQNIKTFLSEHSPLIQRMADMKRANPDGLDKVISLLAESADYKVHPDVALGVGLNERIKGTDHTALDEHHESILAHPRLSDEYNRLTRDEQSLFRDTRDTLTQEGRRNADATFKSYSDALRENFKQDDKLQAALKKSEDERSPSEIKQVERYHAIEQAIEGHKVIEDEHAQFAGDPQIEHLRKLWAMRKNDVPYFPSSRKGGWVVNGEHVLPVAKGALSQTGNEVVFATEKEAFAYRQQLVDASLPSQLSRVREPTSTEQMRGSGKPTFKVTVQVKHSSAYHSRYEAAQAAEALRKMGVKDVTEPMFREKNTALDYGLHSATLRAMDHAVDALTHLSNDQKAALKEANEQAALGLMRGNRINQGLMTRNRVRGANADPILSMHDYLSASARNRARSKHMGDIDKAFSEMRDINRDTQDEETWKRGLLVNEMETRALNFGKEGFTGQMPPALQSLTTLAYLKYMMAPIHYALDLTHNYIISLPQIAGKHGQVETYSTAHKVMNMMGGRTPSMSKGLAGAWQAAWKPHAPTDFVAGIIATLKSKGASADVLRAIEQAQETGHLHSVLSDFRSDFDRTGKAQNMLQRAQNVGQEMSSAVDAVNRIHAYVTAYMLERAKMGEAKTPEANAAHHAQAIRYAKDTLSQTQGLYTAANRSSFLRNPLARAAMQFRSVPMMIYKIMGRNVYNTFKGETPEVKWAAVRSLLGTMGATSLLVGAPGGTPEPIRLAIMLTHMFGLTGSWQQLEDKARRASDAALGKVGGHLVMDGVLGAAGLSAGQRIGMNDLLFSERSMGSVKDALFELVVGSTGGYLNDEASSIGKLLNLDFKHGLPGLMPIRLFSDVMKAGVEGYEGKPSKGGLPAMAPLDPFEMFIKAMGGQPEREALHGKMAGLQREAHNDRGTALRKATEGNTSAMQAWNRDHPRDRITAQQVLKAKQAGKKETPRQRQTREDYRAYQ